MSINNAASTTLADDQVNALAVIQEQITALADPTAAVDGIAAGLDTLYSTGANASALGSIQQGAEALLDNIQQLDQALKATLDTAHQIMDQRHSTQKTLDELKKALKDQKLDVPEIKRLWDSGVEAGEEMVLEGFDVWEESANARPRSSNSPKTMGSWPTQPAKET